jgi:hypothetical protein
MTPVLSYCTAKAFRRSLLPLVELQPGRDLEAANDPLPVARLRCVAGSDPRLPSPDIGDPRGWRLPSHRR